MKKVYVISSLAVCILLLLLCFYKAPVRVNAAKDTMFTFVDKGSVMSIYVDPSAKDFAGMNLVAESFTKDVELITAQKPEVITKTSSLKGNIVIMGSIGNNRLIDEMIASGRLDVSEIEDKWECYKIQVIDTPFDGVEKAIVVVGSDKRGAFYGIYHISELIGVSPWYYWADVAPVKESSLTLSVQELETTSKEPSVKYRGIFLNDEAPSLSSWVNSNFGNYNENFYQHVYELLLRLKGNYLWPAMWSNNFSQDGEDSPIANAELADIYGIVMGTSHHEPMCRAGVEWQRTYRNYGNDNTWDYGTNAEAITKFWEDGIKRNHTYENIITLGMRGEADSALTGSIEYNINLLKDIILKQKKILNTYNLSESPKVLTVYKEVETYWYGNQTATGLRHWDELEDITIMLCDDNFGNVRKLPDEQERDRKAGWGMYYHIDYHGGPKSYEWVCTTPIQKICEQMSMAYDYGIQEIWILNVGDLKPMEMDISYFLDLAYDFDTYSVNGTKGVTNYAKDWVANQFGAYCDEETVSLIADIMEDYLHLNGNRKPETISASTYSITNFNEAQLVLQQCEELIRKCDEVNAKIPDELADAFYQLAYYPAVASANVSEMWIFAGLNSFYANAQSSLANVYGMLTSKCITRDKELQNYYNKTLSAGKWDGMMSSNHVGYVTWNDEGWTYPSITNIQLPDESLLLVDLEGNVDVYRSGTAQWKTFHNVKQECYAITISNGGKTEFDYEISTDCDWLVFSETKGNVVAGTNVFVSVDWSKLKDTDTATFTIRGAGSSVTVSVRAEVLDVSNQTKGTFIETDGIVSIECYQADSFVSASDGTSWKVLNDYGKSITRTSSVKMFPTTKSYDNVMNAPYMEYRVYVDEAGEYVFTMYTAPTNNLSNDITLRYGVCVDGETPTIVSAIPSHYEAGGNSNGPWCSSVTNNVHTSTTSLNLTKGEHTLRIYGVDAGMVFLKFTISRDRLPVSFFGASQSYRVGDEIVPSKGYRYDISNITLYYLPGSIELLSETYESSYVVPVLLQDKNKYILRLYGITNSESTNVLVRIDGEVCGMKKWTNQEPYIEITTPSISKLEAGSHMIEITYQSGTGKLLALTMRETSDINIEENDKYISMVNQAKEKDEIKDIVDLQSNNNETLPEDDTSVKDNTKSKSWLIWIAICVGILGLTACVFSVSKKRNRGTK